MIKFAYFHLNCFRFTLVIVYIGYISFRLSIIVNSYFSLYIKLEFKNRAFVT